MHRFSLQRLLCAALLVAIIPPAHRLPALVTVAALAAVLAALIAYERVRFAELRDRLRRQIAT